MLASVFPALLLQSDRLALSVRSNGYLFARDLDDAAVILEEMSMPQHNAAEIEWELPVTSQQRSSYVRTTHSIPARPSAAIRQQQLATARAHNGLVNPNYEIHGLGEWRWLDEQYDTHIARTRFAITEPHQTVQLRIDHTIAVGEGVNAEPFAVFYPDLEYVNPEVRPAEAGRFYFLTPEAQQLAQLNFGQIRLGRHHHKSLIGSSSLRLLKSSAQPQRRSTESMCLQQQFASWLLESAWALDIPLLRPTS